jgi:hypothetical protein
VCVCESIFRETLFISTTCVRAIKQAAKVLPALFNKRCLCARERRRKKSQIELRLEIIATLSLCHREK